MLNVEMRLMLGDIMGTNLLVSVDENYSPEEFSFYVIKTRLIHNVNIFQTNLVLISSTVLVSTI